MSVVPLAAGRLGGVAVVPLTRQLFARVHLDRNRRAYRLLLSVCRFLLSVCRLLHDMRTVSEASGERRFAGVDVERPVMWQVFERFAARFHAREQREYRVRAQSRVEWWDLRTRGPSPTGASPR